MSRAFVNSGIGGGGNFSFFDPVFNAADFNANGTWTVGAFSNTNYVRYGIFKNARTVYVNITGVYAGAGTGALRITMPFVSLLKIRVAAILFIAGVEEGGDVNVTENTNEMRFIRYGGVGIPAATINVNSQFTIFV